MPRTAAEFHALEALVREERERTAACQRELASFKEALAYYERVTLPPTGDSTRVALDIPTATKDDLLAALDLAVDNARDYAFGDDAFQAEHDALDAFVTQLKDALSTKGGR